MNRDAAMQFIRQALFVPTEKSASESPEDAPKSSTQLTLSPEDAKPFITFAESIPDDELYNDLDSEWSDDPREREPHVTVLYGLTEHDSDAAEEALEGFGPVTIKLGKLSIFEGKDNDVLKVSVEGKQLRKMHAALKKLPHYSSYPNYAPHLTIAYLKKGEGKKYEGDDRFEGQELTFDSVTFSPPPDLRKTLGRPEMLLTKEAAAIAPVYAGMDDDGEPYVPVGVNGIMASTEKLLALNRGLVEPDERDSYAYKRTHTLDKFIKDRIRLDTGKLRRNLIYNIAKTKSLKAAHPFMFDLYTQGMLTGGGGEKSSSVLTPLEEINPMHLVEQARRITQMGPGGIGDSGLITDEARNVHPSQFGFACPISGPESERIGVDARLAWGTRLGSDGKIYQRFFDRRLGRHRWVSADEASRLVVSIPP